MYRPDFDCPIDTIYVCKNRSVWATTKDASDLGGTRWRTRPGALGDTAAEDLDNFGPLGSVSLVLVPAVAPS
jgi:hypothetical protein